MLLLQHHKREPLEVKSLLIVLGVLVFLLCDPAFSLVGHWFISWCLLVLYVFWILFLLFLGFFFCLFVCLF
jgi:membrane protein YdbS with pleckstrin-like domain